MVGGCGCSALKLTHNAIHVWTSREQSDPVGGAWSAEVPRAEGPLLGNRAAPAPLAFDGCSSGRIPKRPKGTDCKSVGSCLRRFESCSAHCPWPVALGPCPSARAQRLGPRPGWSGYGGTFVLPRSAPVGLRRSAAGPPSLFCAGDTAWRGLQRICLPRLCWAGLITGETSDRCELDLLRGLQETSPMGACSVFGHRSGQRGLDGYRHPHFPLPADPAHRDLRALAAAAGWGTSVEPGLLGKPGLS